MAKTNIPRDENYGKVYSMQWRKNHPNYKVEWGQANKERVALYNKAYNEANRMNGTHSVLSPEDRSIENEVIPNK